MYYPTRSNKTLLANVSKLPPMREVKTMSMSENNQLAKIEFTKEQEALIRQQIAPKATPTEMQLFLYQCKRTGLDPLTRQIYCIHLGGKMTIQTSIDGFRVIAERSGSYAGQGEPVFIEQDGALVCAKVSVFRFSPTGQRYEAAVGVAYMSEYRQSSPMWSKMPHIMLAKTAEALALRKAFPQDLSGLYSSEEIAETQDAEVIEPIQTAPFVIDEDVLLGAKLDLDSCKSKKEVKALYNQIKQAVDASPELQKMFKEKQNSFAEEATAVV